MKAKKHAIYRIPSWSILIALGVFFIVLYLVLQQSSPANLSASIPQTSTMPKWSCNAMCECKLMDLNNNVTILGKAETKMNICTYASIPFGQLPPEDQYYADDPCEKACDLQYPNQQNLGTVFSLNFQLTRCNRIGVCFLNPSGQPIIMQSPTPTPSPSRQPTTLLSTPTRTPYSTRTP